MVKLRGAVCRETKINWTFVQCPKNAIWASCTSSVRGKWKTIVLCCSWITGGSPSRLMETLTKDGGWHLNLQPGLWDYMAHRNRAMKAETELSVGHWLSWGSRIHSVNRKIITLPCPATNQEQYQNHSCIHIYVIFTKASSPKAIPGSCSAEGSITKDSGFVI